MLLARSIVFNAVFYAVLVGMMIVGIPVLFGQPQTVRRYARAWANVSLTLLRLICGTTVDIREVAALPAGGCMIASKHQSFLDILALLTVVPRFVFVLKRELMLLPLFGIYLRRAGMIPVDRARGRTVMGELTERVRVALAAGDQLIIFPEGTRRPPGAEPSYKSGVAHLYAGLDTPCVPVALNTGLFWPRRSLLRPPGTVRVDMLPIIPPGLGKAAFQSELQDTIEAASNRLLPSRRAGAGAFATPVS